MLAQPSKRDEALSSLTSLTDPRAVPMIAQVFLAGGRPADLSTAIRLLGQVDSARSSRAIASLAVSARSAEDRRVAIETLRNRDPREFARMLIDGFEEPITYEVRPIAGPGSPGVLVVQGKKFDVRRLYSPPPAPIVARVEGDRQVVDSDGLEVIERPLVNPGQSILAGMEANQAFALARTPGDFAALYNADQYQRAAAQVKTRIPVGRMNDEAERAAESAREQLAGDIAALDRRNRAVRDRNERLAHALDGATGQAIGANAKAWNAWYVDQLGFRARPITAEPADRPTLVEEVPLDFVPREVPVEVASGMTPSVPFGPWGSGGIDWVSRVTSQYKIMFHSCFAAGTPVLTIAGPRPIESLKVGDLVLSQSTATGGLTYRPVLSVYHNPPIVTHRIGLRGDSIVASPFHRFWVAGRGWVMARSLKPGDPIRTLGGVQPVESVDSERVQPVFNLDVAEDGDFFAGKVAALVHDNTLPDPRLAPFDAVTAAKSAEPR